MVDNIIDITTISTFYPLYVTLLLSFLLKIIWVWKIAYSINGTVCDSAKVNVSMPHSYTSAETVNKGNFPINWITKFIKRKESSNDDSDGPYSLFLTN